MFQKNVIFGLWFECIQANVRLPELIRCLTFVGPILGRVIDEVQTVNIWHPSRACRKLRIQGRENPRLLHKFYIRHLSQIEKVICEKPKGSVGIVVRTSLSFTVLDLSLSQGWSCA